ncbi:MAG: family 20 glycosylhydrolase, partial [Phycisphaerae bacterium]
MTKFIGWMYDIAREQSPRPHVLRDMLRQSLESGYNAVGFYLEHRFAYASAPWAADRGVVTPALVKELQEEFTPQGLRIIPFLNTLGHMEGFVRAEEGRKYAEGSRFGTEQICPSREECVRFAKNLIDDAIDAFADDWLHIGGDEPWQLGTCPLCKQRVDEVGKAGLYGEFYRDLCDYVLEKGKRPGLWADMLNEHPDALEYLPKETILFDWQYDKRPLETSQKLRDAGFDIICAPALHTYDAAWCHLDQSIDNIEAHKRDAEALGALGVLLTTWEMAYFTQYATVMPIIYAVG